MCAINCTNVPKISQKHKGNCRTMTWMTEHLHRHAPEANRRRTWKIFNKKSEEATASAHREQHVDTPLPLSQGGVGGWVGGHGFSFILVWLSPSDLWLYLRERPFYPWLLMAYKKITSPSKCPLLIAFQSCLGAVWVWSLVDRECARCCVRGPFWTERRC